MKVKQPTREEIDKTTHSGVMMISYFDKKGFRQFREIQLQSLQLDEVAKVINKSYELGQEIIIIHVKQDKYFIDNVDKS